MNVRYRVTLTQYERNELRALLSGGKSPARKLKRAAPAITKRFFGYSQDASRHFLSQPRRTEASCASVKAATGSR
jgi:hypothetical protein